MIRRLPSRLCLFLLAGALAGPAGLTAGDVFIAGTIGEVYKGDALTGDFQPFAGICLGQIQALALDSQTIYAGDVVGGVARFDLSTGGFEGVFFVSQAVTAMVMHGGDVLVSSAGGNIRRVDPVSGEILDTMATGLSIEAMHLRGNDLFVAGTVGEVYRVDPLTGDVELFGGICLAQIQALASDDQHIFAGDEAGGVARFDLETGDFDGVYFLPLSVTALARDGADLLASGTNHTVLRVDAASGTVLATLNSPIDVQAMYHLSPTPCILTADCADADGDGRRDDNCMWWACDGGVCAGSETVFADLGGEFGQCAPDGIADAHDKYHSLNCFSNADTVGGPGYPCEDSPPQAYNVDAGGSFGDCNPDGVCDGHDAFHTLTAFDGTSSCICSSEGGPQPAQEPAIRGSARLRLVAEPETARAGARLDVHVYLQDPVEDLRGYQLHLAAAGRPGWLQLEDIAIAGRADQALAADWAAFNIDTGQMVAGLDGNGVQTAGDAYLATFTYRVGKQASGAVTIELLADPRDAGQRTFLFPTAPGQRYDVGVNPVTVEVRRPRKPAAG
jgi:hypothetical protein